MAAQEAFAEGWARVDKSIESLSAIASRWTVPQNRDRLAAIKEELPKIRQAQQAAIDTAASGGHDAVVTAGNTYTDKITPVVNGAIKVLGELAQSFDDLIEQNKKEIAGECLRPFGPWPSA